MNKIQKFIKGYMFGARAHEESVIPILLDLFKNFFLDNKQKLFINHNYDIFRTNKTDNLNKKIILLELNITPANTIAYSYLADQLSKKYNAKLTAFFPRIPKSFIKKIMWKSKFFFGSPAYSIFKSFGVNSFLVPSLNNYLSKESNRIYKEQLGLINNKSDLENITIYDVLFGDLIYDYFLKWEMVPTIDIKSKKFRTHLKYCIKLIVYWNNFLVDNDVVAINVSHTVYSNAIPLRIAAKLGIDCFQCNESHVYRLTHDNPFAYKEFVYYRKLFSKLNDEEKVSGIKKAKERIDRRFLGEVGVDMSYSKKSAFTAPVKDRLLSKTDKIKILLAPHCFFDSPHPYGINLYPDVFEWLEELVRISKLTDYEWYVKTHPDFMIETKSLVEDYFKPHSKFKILPSETSHLQLVEEGIDFTLTMYGTVGFEYAAMNKTVINASLNNPHLAYGFNINPTSREEYTEILMDLKNVNKPKINLNDVYEYYYMHHLHFNRNWLFENFDLTENLFALGHGRMGQDTAVYPYWVDNWSKKKDEQILDNLGKFIESGEYRMRPEKVL
mgnify:CR=1 FL=1